MKKEIMQKKPRILITATSFSKSDPRPLQRLKEYGCEIVENPRNRSLKEDELIPLLADVDGVIAGLDEFTEKAMASSPRLRVVSRYGVGLDNVDLASAKRLGIAVMNTPEVNTQAVADFTFGLLLAVSRVIPQSHRSTMEGRWEKVVGRGVYRKTLGIVGLGRIGRAVAERARGFAMTILAYDVKKDDPFARALGVTFSPLDTLLAESDFVTLHCDLNPRTRGLIGARELGLMKETGYLINTARGGLVEEGALYEALQRGSIAGAALDTFVHEPLGETPLTTLGNVVMTPHMGAYTHDALLEMGLISVENLIKVLNRSDG
jgi:D-3-phosphoglycerate dehydrogenase